MSIRAFRAGSDSAVVTSSVLSDKVQLYDATTNQPKIETLTNLAVTLATGISGALLARQSATLSATSGDTGTTLTNLAGLVLTVVPGTYRFNVNLPGVATANSGMKVAFKYTTTVLSAINYTAKGFTASGVAVSNGTTATDQASMLASTTAIIKAEIDGTFVVTTGGTIQVQGAQNASHADTTSYFLGGTFSLSRIA